MGAAIGAILSGIAIWFIGNKFNSPAKSRTFIDKESGQEVIVKPDHSLFFIKMQYWAFIVSGFGVIMLIGILVNGRSPF
jgi:membrane protein YqaA with SNARE-associated domain